MTLRIDAKTLCAALSIILSFGCAHHREQPAAPSPSTPQSAAVSPNTSQYLLQPGDVLDIDSGHRDMPPEAYLTPIDAHGDIQLPFNITLHVAGLTTSEVQVKIHDAYVPKYFNRLEIRVKLVPSN